MWSVSFLQSKRSPMRISGLVRSTFRVELSSLTLDPSKSGAIPFRRGSVPEIVDEGVTGYIVDTPEEAIEVLPDVLSLDRRAVRQRFEERFSAERMARDYLKVYHSLLRTPAGRDVEDRELETPRRPGRMNGNGKGFYAD